MNDYHSTNHLIKLINGPIQCPVKEQVFEEADKKWICPNCKQYWKVNMGRFQNSQDRIGPSLTEQRCPHCNSDMDGKVYPKTRDKPREIRSINIVDNPELDQIISQTLLDNNKVVSDYRNGKKQSIGFLIGAVLKQIKTDPSEVKFRLEGKLQ
jgi:hypothetical protein